MYNRSESAPLTQKALVMNVHDAGLFGGWMIQISDQRKMCIQNYRYTGLSSGIPIFISFNRPNRKVRTDLFYTIMIGKYTGWVNYHIPPQSPTAAKDFH